MHNIESLRSIFEQELEKLDLSQEPAELYDPIKYTMALGGKRLRPLLTLIATDMFDGEVEKAVHPAIGIEIFHNFTLLHDDIMDQAPLRRGKPAVYKKWNPNIAILSGDTMFALAYDQLVKTNINALPEILEVFTKTAIQVCEGQQFDMNFEVEPDVSIDDYLNMIRLKTAVLFAASLKIGAIIGGASRQNANLLYQFGENIGLAFQLKDDLLDVFGDEEKFGKKKGGDIVVNKKTYLFLKAFELAEGSDLEELRSCYLYEKYSGENKVERVTTIYNNLNIRDITLKKINDYYVYAQSLLDGVSVNKSNKTALSNLVERLIQRDH
jgi:geranylgeranyl diphosphate synthase type II